MRARWIIAVAIVVVVALGGVGFWYFALRSDAPERFSITTDTTSGAPGVTTPLAGTWTVGRNTDGTPSEAGYRVSERFAGGVVDVDGVGRSAAVTGEMTIAGTTVTAVTVTVDTRELKSDQSRRDNKMRTDGLETNRFPTATFTLTQPIDLDGGTGITRTDATGDLTLHGVTRPVTLALEASRSGDVITVVGSTPIAMVDFDITPPSIPGFVTVADTGTLELQVFFVRTGGGS